MALPAAVPVLVAFLAALGPWLVRFAQMYLVQIAVSFLGRLGILIATNEMIIQPMIDNAMNAWNMIPSAWQCWFNLLGINKAASIMVSFMTLVMAKKIFFVKS